MEQKRSFVSRAGDSVRLESFQQMDCESEDQKKQANKTTTVHSQGQDQVHTSRERERGS